MNPTLECRCVDMLMLDYTKTSHSCLNNCAKRVECVGTQFGVSSLTVIDDVFVKSLFEKYCGRLLCSVNISTQSRLSSSNR